MIESTMSDTHAQYEPVAWWFTRRRLGRELRNYYQVPEEWPARLLTLISELDGKPEISLADDVPAFHLQELSVVFPIGDMLQSLKFAFCVF